MNKTGFWNPLYLVSLTSFDISYYKRLYEDFVVIDKELLDNKWIEE